MMLPGQATYMIFAISKFWKDPWFLLFHPPLKHFNDCRSTMKHSCPFTTNRLPYQSLFRHWLMICSPYAQILQGFWSNLIKIIVQTLSFPLTNQVSSFQKIFSRMRFWSSIEQSWKQCGSSPTLKNRPLLKVLRSSHRAFTRLLHYHYCRLVKMRQKCEQNEMLSTCRQIMDFRTSMNPFDGIDSNTTLHFLSKFVKECDLARISEVQVCVMLPNFLKEWASVHFHGSRNASSCAGLCYLQEFFICFHSMYTTTTAIRNRVMQWEGLRKSVTSRNQTRI